MTDVLLTRNVFVAGGTPQVTYNPRDDRRLEDDVRDYLNQTGKALSISGPTKSGKTVLVRRLLPEDRSIWLYGSDLTSTEEFWRAIVDWLGLYDAVEVSTQHEAQVAGEVGGKVGVPFVGSVDTKATAGGSYGGGRTLGRQRAYSDVAREGLRTLPVPIVIDDFHYVPESVRRDIARAVKTVLPLTHVVMIAVPHEAFEAVREEPDMGGRVWHLRIDHWSDDELSFIAEEGFKALNVVDHRDFVTRKLVDNSFGAPFLMQQLCYDVMAVHKILETQDPAVDLAAIPDWEGFFSRIAERAAPPVFERLRKGPKSRGQERMERVIADTGTATDIYGAVLYAISLTGPKPVIAQQELVRILDSKLAEPARGQHISSCLGNMSEIAEENRGTGDAALVFKNDEVYILDPFLLFFLRWGTWPTESYTRHGA